MTPTGRRGGQIRRQSNQTTSAARFTLVALQPEDLNRVWQELGLMPGAAVGLCVRSIKICPSTTCCHLGIEDVGGLHLDKKYHGMPLP